jgi:parallel beta-helix repeat protein
MTTKSEGMMIPGKLKWYVILALALWLVFSGVAAAEQLYVNESGWWRDGGAFNASGTPIQAAVDAASAEDAIYVHGGTYYENVDVDTPRLTLGGEGADVVTVSAASSDDNVFEVTANGVNISGFTVTRATGDGRAGIHINGADHCNIYGNNASKNENGILLQHSSNNTISANIANANDNRGILMWSSSDCNIISNNTMNSNTRRGISMDYSSSNKLSNNNALENEIGIGMWNSTSNTLMNNTASDNTNIGIYLCNSSSNTLSNNAANSNNENDISLYNSNSNTLQNNTAANSNNYHGIELDSSSNNTLTNNTAESNNHYGISLYNSSNNILRSSQTTPRT